MVKKQTVDTPPYALSAGFYILFILAVLLFLIAFTQIVYTASRDSDAKATDTDPETKIKQLISLKNEGILTQEEFSEFINRLRF